MTTFDYAHQRRGLPQQMGMASTERRKQQADELLQAWRESP